MCASYFDSNLSSYPKQLLIIYIHIDFCIILIYSSKFIRQHFVYNFFHIFIISDPQVNIIDESLEEQDDFHIQLSSSYNSKLQSADLLKLQSIRTKKK